MNVNVGAADMKSLIVDAAGNSYVTGYTGSSNLFIWKWNTSGMLLWQNRFTDANRYGYAVAVFGEGVCIAGYTAGTKNKGFVARLPADGSKTGTWGSYVYTTDSSSYGTSSLSSSANARSDSALSFSTNVVGIASIADGLPAGGSTHVKQGIV
jgi:hypothetical protein